ncbi:MAG: alpha-L-fucosidase [Candidatus Sumerlaeota bacterium]|nr:alpha-L-fucosidase [Candidatus Sumerlaeota bacterium]
MPETPKPEPRVAAYEKMLFGMQMHWGLYSLLGEGEWIMHRKQIPPQEYNPLRDRFTAKEFDPRAISRLAKDAGMKYVTLTTRHHDGFSLYDTRGLSTFDAPHSAAGRDLVAEFVDGCRAEGMPPFFYHTTLDWQWDSAKCDESKFNEYLDYFHASIEVLCKHYGPVGGFRFDGNWSRWDANWKESRLYGIIRKHQPDTIIINNPGMGRVGQITHPELDVANFEQHGIQPLDRRGAPKYLASTMSQTINNHWGFGRLDLNYKPPREIIETLARCLGMGATYILNVGPTGSGAIPELDAATLRSVGVWTHLYEKALYGAKPVAEVQCDAPDFVAENDGRWYFFVHRAGVAGDANVVGQQRGAGPRSIRGLQKPVRSIRWLNNDEPLAFEQDAAQGHVTIHCTGHPYGTNLIVRVAEMEF